MANDIFYTTVKLEVYQDNKYLWLGTGFFYRNENKKYIVTNKHILDSESRSFFKGGTVTPNKIIIKIHSSLHDLTQHISWEIKLSDKFKKYWLSHPEHRGTSDCDIALIPLDTDTLIGENLNTFMPFNSPKLTFISDELFNTWQVNNFGFLAVIGYPLGFHDQQHNLPVGRAVSVASPYDIDFNGKPCFLVDGLLLEGMSGSPVVCTPHNLFQQGKPEGHKFFGVYSSRLYSNKQPLNLHVVWKAHLITEIATQAV
jgi:hypothetical protein